MTTKFNISNVYLIGIGGIGMSALAKYFLQQNISVSGYDKTPSEITTRLQEAGAKIHFEENVDLLDRQAGLVIYTPAVPKDHKELAWYRDNDYPLKKRSEVLAAITEDGFNICIAGTHGKTTISILTAFILEHSGFGCNAFLGGISVNYNSNYWGGDHRVNVVEADEYDRSFLKLSPDIAVVSAMDADHLDIYGDVETMRNAFSEFASRIRNKGLLLNRFGLKLADSTSYRHYSYSLQNNTADIYASGITMKEGGYEFSVTGPGWALEGIRLHMGGMHNVENTVVASAIAHELGLEDDQVKNAIAAFKGVRRRFEYIISPKESKDNPHNVVFIDDYAHHPEELRALLQSARSLFNNRWITVIFQPHLFSRTRDFHKEFADVLGIANQVILLPVYPARELPIEGVTSGMIAGRIRDTKVKVIDYEELTEWVETEYIPALPHSMDGDVLVTAGAGNIDRLVQPIKEKLLKR